MIVRKPSNDAVIVMGQTDHSRLVGQLAAHWGNDRFAPPRPYDSIARAAAFHDYGWLRYETSPMLDAKTGRTPNFRDIPTTAEQLASYQWCVDWLSGVDRYSGLIVSMHRTGLWKGRYQTISHPSGMSRRDLAPGVEAFIARNEAWQEEERRRHDEGEVWTNYRLLQVWDLLGLYFCCQDPYDDHIEPVPVSYGGDRASGVRMTMKAVGPRKVAFDPYPFDRRPCHVQLAYRRLPDASYGDTDSMRRAYFQAEHGLMEFELV